MEVRENLKYERVSVADFEILRKQKFLDYINAPAGTYKLRTKTGEIKFITEVQEANNDKIEQNVRCINTVYNFVAPFTNLSVGRMSVTYVARQGYGYGAEVVDTEGNVVGLFLFSPKSSTYYEIFKED